MTRLFLVSIIAFLGVFIVLYLTSPIDPVYWRPDPNSSLTGPYKANNLLDSTSLLTEAVFDTPEDLAFDDKGFLYTGLRNGAIIKINTQQASEVETIVNTGGRPIGIRLDHKGNIIVGDPLKGLLLVEPTGKLSVLTHQFEGNDITLVNQVSIAANGDIYFSNASSKYGFYEYIYGYIEASATGQVLKYSPSTKQTTEVVANIQFANGVAIGPKDEYLLVSESGRSRILKHYLRGAKQGETEVFIDALPGMPDNIYLDENGIFWVSLVAMRDWRVEKLASFPSIRKVIAHFPQEWLHPQNQKGFVLGINEEGKIVHNYQTNYAYTRITAAVPYAGKLYLAGINQPSVGVFSELK